MKRLEIPEEREVFSKLVHKPLFDNFRNYQVPSPFYDPNNLHVHLWKVGKLGVEEDPKNPEYSKEKINIKNCTYCTICHMIKNKYNSNISGNRNKHGDVHINDNNYTPKYSPMITKTSINSVNGAIGTSINSVNGAIGTSISMNDIGLVNTNTATATSGTAISDTIFFQKREGIFDNYYSA